MKFICQSFSFSDMDISPARFLITPWLNGLDTKGGNILKQKGLEKEPNSFRSLKQCFKYLVKDHPDQKMPICFNDEIVEVEFNYLKAKDGGRILMFHNKELADEFDEHNMYTDGTHTAIPKIKGVSQLLTVIGKKHNQVIKDLET